MSRFDGDAEKNPVLDFIKTNLGPIIAGGLFLLLFIIMLIVTSVNRAQVSGWKNQLSDVQGKLEVASAKSDEALGDAVQSSVGVNFNRANEDTDIVRKIIEERLFAWNSGSEYLDVRKDFMQRYHVDDGSMFERVMIPVIDEAANLIDGYGCRLSLEDIRPNIVRISDAAYDYVTEIDVVARDGNDHEARGTFVLLYYVDADGKVGDWWASRSYIDMDEQ